MIQAIRPETSSERGPSLASLVAGILEDARRLLNQQLECFKAEIRDDLIRLAIGLGLIAVGVGLSLLGGLLLTFMCVYLLHELAALPLWLSFLIVGGAFLLLGATLGFIAAQRFRAYNPLPDQSLTALQETIQWKTNLN